MSSVLRHPRVGERPRYVGSPDRPVLHPDVVAAIDEAAAEAYERGVADGRRAERAEVTQAAAALRAGVERAVAQARRFRVEDGGAALATALDLAEFVLGYAPHDDGRTLVGRVEEALTELDDRPLRLAVHPSDSALIEDVFGGTPDLVVEADPRMSPGEARIVGPWAEADLTRRAALDVIRRELA